MDDFRDDVFPHYRDHELSMVRKRVLLLPGMLCTNFLWSRIKESPMLRENGILCTAREPMGFAGQVPDGPYSYSIASYAERLKNWLSVEPPFDAVVGHSFFGNVIARAAPGLPESIHAIMISPALVREARPLYCYRQLEIAKKPIVGELFALYGRYFPGVIERELKASIPIDRQPVYLEELVCEAKRTGPSVLRALFVSFFDSVLKDELLEKALNSKCRISLVEGAKDVTNHPEDAAKRFQANPRAKLVKLEEAGHFSMLDVPRDLIEFIEPQVRP